MTKLCLTSYYLHVAFFTESEDSTALFVLLDFKVNHYYYCCLI